MDKNTKSKNKSGGFCREKYPEELQLVHDSVDKPLAKSPEIPDLSKPEKQILEDCVRCFGIGKWEEIMKGNYLPGKARSQLITQVERSMAEFARLRCSLISKPIQR